MNKSASSTEARQALPYEAPRAEFFTYSLKGLSLLDSFSPLEGNVDDLNDAGDATVGGYDDIIQPPTPPRP